MVTADKETINWALNEVRYKDNPVLSIREEKLILARTRNLDKTEKESSVDDLSKKLFDSPDDEISNSFGNYYVDNKSSLKDTMKIAGIYGSIALATLGSYLGVGYLLNAIFK
jgi:hypothetical protein